MKSLVHGHTASRRQSVPEPRLHPPGLRAIAQQMHEGLSPTAAALGSFPPAVRAASCRWAASQTLPCAKLPIGLLLTHPSVTSGSIVAEGSRRGGPKSPSPTPDSAITSCAPRSKSLSFSGFSAGEEPVRVVGNTARLSHGGPCSTSLGLTASLGIAGKSPNCEPQFPHLSNVVLNQKL